MRQFMSVALCFYFCFAAHHVAAQDPGPPDICRDFQCCNSYGQAVLTLNHCDYNGGVPPTCPNHGLLHCQVDAEEFCADVDGSVDASYCDSYPSDPNVFPSCFSCVNQEVESCIDDCVGDSSFTCRPKCEIECGADSFQYMSACIMDTEQSEG